MIRATPTARVAVAAFLALLVVGIGAVLIAGTQQRRGTVLTAGVQPYGVVTTLGPGQRACEHAVFAPSPVREIVIWTQAPLPAGALTLTARGSGLRPQPVPVRLDRSLPPVSYGAAASARLTSPAPGGSALTFCLVAHESTGLLGGTPSSSSGRLTIGRQPSQFALSFVLQAPNPPSVVGQLTTIVDRASLFRPTWVGTWTFWTLAALLVVAVLVFARGLSIAAAQDAEAELGSGPRAPTTAPGERDRD